MEPGAFLTEMIDPGLKLLAGLSNNRPSVSDDAKRMLLAIALQESGPNLDARYQNSPSSSPGPARGFWQFEQGGGVTGVINNSNSKTLASEVCKALTFVVQPAAVWRGLEGSSILACCFARLLLWTDPYVLPNNEQDGWDCYIRLWRPGKPHPEVWPDNWGQATTAVNMASTVV